MSEPTITHDESAYRYDLTLDGETIGHIRYRDDSGRRVILHTKVDEAHGGKGYGTLLVRGTLDQIRDADMKVVTLCPMASAFVRKNPEYHDMVDPEHTLHG